MSDPLDIDALHATWEAAQKGTPHFLPWATAITDAWPAIYERLRELEASVDYWGKLSNEHAKLWQQERVRADSAEARAATAEALIAFLGRRRAAVAERARTEGE